MSNSNHFQSKWPRSLKPRFGYSKNWYQSKLRRHLERRQHVDLIRRELRRQKEENMGSYIRQISQECKDMLKKIDAFCNIKEEFSVTKLEDQMKFLFTYGIGDVYIKDDGHGCLVPGVHYAPEVTLNILSMDLLKKQGYEIKYDGNRCSLTYMFNDKEHQIFNEDRMRTLHNQYLENCFGSLDDGIDKGLIRIKGSLYSTKVQTFNDYVYFLNLVKQDEIVDQEWDYFRNRFNKTARAPRRECIRDFNQADPNMPSNNLEEGTGAQSNAGLKGKEKVEHFGVKLEGTSSKEDTQGKDHIPHSARNLNLQGMHLRYSISKMQGEDDSGTDNTSEEFTIIT
ncbi:hypothetical protein Tco_0078487 [Tanacetum coccineum]